MDPAVEELSPEEKLLKVIQGGDAKGKPPAAAAPVPAPPSRPAAAEPLVEPAPARVAPPPVVRPKLKLAGAAQPVPAAVAAPAAAAAPPRQEEARARPAPEAKQAAAAQPEPAPRPVAAVAERKEPQPKPAKKERPAPAPIQASAAAAAPAASEAARPKRARRGGFGIRVINRCLAAAIVVLLCLCGLEIFARAGLRGEPPPAPGEGGEQVAPPQEALTALELVRKAFQEKQIWDMGEEPPPGPGPGPKPPPEPAPVEETLKLIGLSRRPGAAPDQVTAVIMNNKEKKMYFLKPGEKLPFNAREFKVEEVFPDRVVVAEGQTRLTIK